MLCNVIYCYFVFTCKFFLQSKTLLTCVYQKTFLKFIQLALKFPPKQRDQLISVFLNSVNINSEHKCNFVVSWWGIFHFYPTTSVYICVSVITDHRVLSPSPFQNHLSPATETTFHSRRWWGGIFRPNWADNYGKQLLMCRTPLALEADRNKQNCE